MVNRGLNRDSVTGALEFKHFEGINIEVSLNGNKWLVSGAYKPPSMSDELFEQDCTFGMGKISEKYEDFFYFEI